MRTQRNILASALGHYDEATADEMKEGDALIGLSFGTSIGPGSVNYELGVLARMLADGRPILADSAFFRSIPDSARFNQDAEQVHVVDPDEDIQTLPLQLVTELPGEISTEPGKGAGSWGTLHAAYTAMAGVGLHRPILIANGHHVGRAARQAEKLRYHPDFLSKKGNPMMDPPIIPAYLPRHFDRHSDQLWTRNIGAWMLYEALGSLVLRHRGQL
jgi:hypothetical protein